MAKGITPVIAIILLLLITISITGFAMIFFSRTMETAGTAGEEELKQQMASASQSFRIESAYNNKVTVRNLGTAPLANLRFFVNGADIDYSGCASIPAGSVETCTLNDAKIAGQPSSAELKATSTGYQDRITIEPYKDNTVAYWTFDDSDGRTVKDKSGNGNDGTFVGETWNDGNLKPLCPNCPQIVTGKVGNALQFDGVDDYVDIGTDSNLNPANAMTVEVWAKPSTGNSAVFLRRDNAAYSFGIDGSTIMAAHFGDGVTWTEANRINIPTVTGQWNHFAWTFDLSAQQLKFYHNGVLRATITKTTPIGQGNTYTGIGGAGGYPYFNGIIDEVRIYNRALTQQEIQEDMNSAYPINRPVASYSFEKTENNKVLDTHNVVKGKYGAALSFDGVDDYVDTGSGTSTNFVTEDFTIELWVKASGGTLVQRGARQVNGYTLMADPYIHLLTHQSGTYTYVRSQHPVNTGQWQHWVAVKIGTTAKLYLDGVEDTPYTSLNDPINNPVSAPSDPLRIGTGSWGYFNGIIDEVRILNVARSG